MSIDRAATTPDQDETEDRSSGAVGAPQGLRRRWHGLVVAIGGALAILLLGATAGMLIGVPRTATPTPAAESVDVGFCQDMSAHHEQAVEMAGWVRDHSTDPLIRGIAHDIESNQTEEIGRMQGWLAMWGAPPAASGPYMAWMAAEPTGHVHGLASVPTGGVAVMPGMASPDELRALKTASGPQLDMLFLQLMLRHHEGGAPMLSYAAQHAEVPVVRALAGQMASAQASETETLRTILTERGGSPLPL